MSMGHADTRRDLTVTQMLRFSRLGKTIFCEFGSFVLSPGAAGTTESTTCSASIRWSSH
jgi:hypothetical protein